MTENDHSCTGLRLREGGMNVVEPNIALQFWNTMCIAMGKNLIQEQILRMEEFVSFWLLLQEASVHSGPYQDVNDPPSSSCHESARLWSFCSCLLLLSLAFIQLSFALNDWWNSLQWNQVHLPSPYSYELIDHITPTSCCAYHMHFHFTFSCPPYDPQKELTCAVWRYKRCYFFAVCMK